MCIAVATCCTGACGKAFLACIGGRCQAACFCCLAGWCPGVLKNAPFKRSAGALHSAGSRYGGSPACCPMATWTPRRRPTASNAPRWGGQAGAGCLGAWAAHV
jgi:hypothetical protein